MSAVRKCGSAIRCPASTAPFVMAGLVPAIHGLNTAAGKEVVDARHKAGQDETRCRAGPYPRPVSSITPSAVRIGSGSEATTRSQTTRVGMTGSSQTMSLWKAKSAQAVT
jgi:hypothetical protein